MRSSAFCFPYNDVALQGCAQWCNQLWGSHGELVLFTMYSMLLDIGSVIQVNDALNLGSPGVITEKHGAAN